MNAQLVTPESETIQICFGSSSSSRRKKRKTLGPAGGSDPSNQMDDYGRDAGGLRFITDEKRHNVRAGATAIAVGAKGGPGGAALTFGGFLLGKAP